MEIEKESVPQYTLLMDHYDMMRLREIVMLALSDKSIHPEESKWGRHFLDVVERLIR